MRPSARPPVLTVRVTLVRTWVVLEAGSRGTNMCGNAKMQVLLKYSLSNAGAPNTWLSRRRQPARRKATRLPRRTHR